jgi:Fe2+ transport system protein FeoA
MVIPANYLTKGQEAVIIACGNHQMQDIGFVVGERIKVISIMPFGGPKAVRIGQSTFAVRDEELSTVEVEIEE